MTVKFGSLDFCQVMADVLGRRGRGRRPQGVRLITRRYRLEEINQGYRDMHAGINLRGVVDF
jgi:Zn-dependent alcohol dehydrogenase